MNRLELLQWICTPLETRKYANVTGNGVKMRTDWVFIFIWSTGFGYMLLTTTRAATITLHTDEVEALKQIAKSLGKTDWNFGVDPCSGAHGWITPDAVEGSESNVTCSCDVTACHITSIVLISQNLSGVLPPELVKLPFIQILDLKRNYINGTIPLEWGATKLVKLSLIGNRLCGTIPKEIGNITTLREFLLEMNRFSGALPPALGNLSALQKLFLNSNNFSGPLPQEFARLSNLTDFRISDNQFTGTIPEFIENWTKLYRIEIQASGLEGPIPASISQLSRLQEMRLSDLSGAESVFPDLSKLISLKNVMLRSCNIIGEIPAYVGNFTNLKLLDLSFNKLRGHLPESFNQLLNVKFMYLSGNLLTGDLPEWMLKEGENVDLSYNNFTTKELNCQQANANLFGSYLRGNDSGLVPCLKNFHCQGKNYSMNINCGGNVVTINGTTYNDDLDPSSPSRFFKSNYNWASSSTGNFLDNNMEKDNYTAQNSSRLEMEDYQLYTSARLSPNSLTYYGYCMGNGVYTVKLHFAEIQFTNDQTYSSIGRRIFDVYIQGNRVLKDFNIEAEAGRVSKAVIKNFTTSVNETLEIRLFWTGKGTQGIPERGVYGPLISAISVFPNFVPPPEGGKNLSEGGKNISVGAVSGILVSVLSLILLVLAILWWKGCLRRKATNQELRGLHLQTGCFTLRQIKAATNNFDPVNKIGEGGFGSVYKGILLDGTIIAVKQLSSKSKQGNREFLNEIGMISSLKHAHLVKLYGCCIEENQLLLVYEYLENNSLAHALYGSEEIQIKLDWRIRHKICLGIAKGLTYLHEESRLKIVHRDIKATNVLLDKDLHPKISDFGLAKLDEEKNTHMSTRIAGTFGYMAPEYAMKGYLTDKADVYSFGIVALEIVSGRSSLNKSLKEECVHLLDWAIDLLRRGDLMELVDPRLGTDYNKEEVMGMINIALACTNVTSTLRPSMSAVVSMLEGRTAVEEAVSDTIASTCDLEFKDIMASYKSSEERSLVDTHSQSISAKFSYGLGHLHQPMHSTY